MDIKPQRNVTINGLKYLAGETYSVNYTTFTKMIAAGCMKSDMEPACPAATIEASEAAEPAPESKPAARRTRRSKTNETK